MKYLQLNRHSWWLFYFFLLCKFQIFLKFIHDIGSPRFVNLIIYKIFVRKPKFSFYFYSLTLYLCRVFNWMRAGLSKNPLKALETVKKDFCHNLFLGSLISSCQILYPPHRPTKHIKSIVVQLRHKL